MWCEVERLQATPNDGLELVSGTEALFQGWRLTEGFREEILSVFSPVVKKILKLVGDQVQAVVKKYSTYPKVKAHVVPLLEAE